MMPEDGITSYGIGGFLRPLSPEVLRKEEKRLTRRAECLRRKASIAKLLGNTKRQHELLAQAQECQVQVEQLA
jgi:hypothetical protein